MEKILVPDVNEKCSCCGRVVEEAYIILSPKGNKLVCRECDSKKGTQKKISITVKEFEGFGYNLWKIFNSKKMFRVVSQKNILLPEYIPEDILMDYMNTTNIEVTVK